MTITSQGQFRAGRFALAVSLISGSLLALEILFVRLVSILLYPVATYLVISLALLGLGASGGILSLLDERRISQRLAGFGAFGFAFAILLSLITIWYAGSSGAFAWLLPLALSMPMFFGGMALAAAFSNPQSRIPILYFADLVGAGLAALSALLGLHYFGAIQVALAIGITGLLSAWLFLGPAKRSYLLGSIALFGLLMGLSPQLPNGISPISPKELRLMRNLDEEVQWEYQGWSALARVDVLSVPDDVLIPGRTVNYKLVTHDGGAPSLLLQVESTSEKEFLIENTIFGVPYWLKEQPSVLIIGLGAGPDVVAALSGGASNIRGAEVSPEMIAIVEEHFASFVGNPYSRERVQIELTDGRHLLARTDEKFDLIQLTGVDTTVASLGGNPNLAENYLYTREAFGEYLDHLNPDGLLSVSFPNVEGLGLRLVALSSEALEAHGHGSVEEHVVVGEMTGYVHLLVSPSAFTPEQIALLKNHYQQGPTSVYFPLYHRLFGTPEESFIADTQLMMGPNIEPLSPYKEYLEALSHGEGEEFLASQPYTLEPPTDQWPFFFVLDKLGYQAVNYETLFVTLAMLLIFSILLMIVPPLLFKRRGLLVARPWSLVIFFGALGLGFIFVEVLFIQKLSLILGHPSYSLALTLSVLLMSSGVGSLLSTRVKGPLERKASLAALSIALLVLFTNLALDRFGDLILQQSLPVRLFSSAIVVALPGIFMGIPFPTGLSMVRKASANFVPWGWGINATFTVIGTILTLIVALASGFQTVLIGAVGLYLTSLLAIQAFSRESSG